MSMFISSIAKQVDIYSYSVIITLTTGEINYAFEDDDKVNAFEKWRNNFHHHHQ